MTGRPDPRLVRLLGLAELLADRATRELAAAADACAALERQLAALAEQREGALALAGDLADGLAAARLLARLEDKRAELLSDLARLSAVRMVKLDAARAAEGRRQALSRLAGRDGRPGGAAAVRPGGPASPGGR